MNWQLRGLIRTMVQVGRWHMAGALGLILALSLTEGLGLAIVLPTLQAAGLSLGGQGTTAHYVAVIENGFAAAGLHPGFNGWLAMCAIVLVTRNLLERQRSVSTLIVQVSMEDALRRRLYRAIANADWLFIARARSSDFLHALTSEIERVSICVFAAMLLGGELALLILYSAIAMALSVPMTAVVIGCGIVLAFAMKMWTRRIEQRGREAAEIIGRFYSGASEYLTSLKAAKAYGAEEHNYHLYSATCRRMVELCKATAREQSAVTSWFELGGWAIMLPLFYLAMRAASIASAELLILLGLFWRLMPRFQSCHLHYRNLVNTLPSFTNLKTLEERCIAAAEPAQSCVTAPVLRKQIRLNKVSFTYQKDAGPILSNVNLTIPAGAVTALTGASGSGKSTIADLLMGLIRPDTGCITVDGAPLTKDSTKAWRRSIGYVADQTPLFHLSIRENLLWANPQATEAMLWDALTRVAAAEFVGQMPNGLDTIVGDRGLLLSQGERQRIALARALLRRPAVLVLDEATNSLDHANEARVLNTINRLRGQVTVVLIAHRLSTIRWADLIYVVENGTVAEFGGWEELSSRRNGRLHALHTAQAQGSALE